MEDELNLIKEGFLDAQIHSEDVFLLSFYIKKLYLFSLICFQFGLIIAK